MTSTSCIHVVPDSLGSWRVQREGAEQPLSEHGSETEAESAAAAVARAAGTSEIIVHDRYERVHRAPDPQPSGPLAGEREAAADGGAGA
jgi:Uncharacterized protein conserved in bacteria (DUF2188)